MIYQVYSKENCIWCERAIKLLEQKNLPHTVYKLGTDFDIDQLKQIFPEAKSFPQIRLSLDIGKHRHIGGYTDLYESLK